MAIYFMQILHEIILILQTSFLISVRLPKIMMQA
jgi:hypothetical protein